MRVLTLTANLLAETTYTFDDWREGATQRARSETFQVGGKGINVTRMLHRMGVDTLALCFPGGAAGARCEAWMREHAIPCRTFPVLAETRSGAVVRAPNRHETTFLGRENIIDAGAVKACAAFLDACRPGEVLAIGGSIPGWAGHIWEHLRDSITFWISRGTLVVDSYGPPLPWLARLPVALVKVNRREFAGLAGANPDETGDDRMADLLTETASRFPNVVRWVISDGPNPIWFLDSGGLPQALNPPAVTEISQTGSGDVLTAGLIHALMVGGFDLAQAVARAAPMAAANAAEPGVAEFDLGPFGL